MTSVAVTRLLSAGRLRPWFANVRGYFTVVVGTGLMRILALGTAILLARALGVSTFGEMSVFLAFLSFWIGSDVLDHTFVRFANTPDANPDAYLRAVFVLKVAFNAVLLAVSFPLATLLASHVFDKPSLSTPIFAAILCGIGLNFLSLRAATHQAREHFARFTATNASFYVLTFLGVVAVLLAWPGDTLTAVYAVYLAAALLVGAYAVVSVKRLIGDVHVDKPIVRAAASFAKWLLAADSVFMVYRRLDVFLLAALASLHDVGEYGAALRVAQVVGLLTGTLAPALIPRAVKATRTTEALRGYLKLTATLSAAIGTLALIVWLAAPLIVETVFGSDYGDAATAVRVYLIGSFLISVYGPVSELFVVDGKPRRMFYLASVKLGVLAAAGLLLVPMLQTAGAALAVTVSEAAALVFVFFALRHRLRAVIGVGDSTRGAGDAPVRFQG